MLNRKSGNFLDHDLLHHEEDVQAINLSDRRKSKSADVRYISLKPLAKKERKRQQRLARQVCSILISLEPFPNSRPIAI